MDLNTNMKSNVCNIVGVGRRWRTAVGVGGVQPLQVLVCTTDTKLGDVFFERDVVICMWPCWEMAQQ